jgi:N-methylhydantoinase B
VSFSAAGGGYGPAIERDPAWVLRDVVEGFVTMGRAREAYGVVLSGDAARWETLAVDEQATVALRARMGEAGDDAGRAQRPSMRWWTGAVAA